MLVRSTSQRLSANAPAIVHELRNAFDARILELTRDAIAQLPSEPPEGTQSTAHAFFTLGALHVTVVYNRVSEEFTQLIARDVAEEGADRPSFTISLFL